MSRYENTKIKHSIINRGVSPGIYNILHHGTTVYSTIPETDSDIFVITQHGDRLDNLAQQFYGDPSLWWYIAKANNLSFMTLPIGTSLRIPGTTNYAIGT